METPVFQLTENETSLKLNATRKRKANDALPGPQLSRRRCSSALTSESSTISSSATIQSPEPLSINYLIREQSRSRLYVSPLRWTSQHLQLLDCRFLPEEPEPKRRPSSSNADKDYRAREKAIHCQGQNNERVHLPTMFAIHTVASHLFGANMITFKTSAIRDFLEDCGMHPLSEQVPPPILEYP